MGMVNSSNLQLPYIAAAQAQKHITHNEAIRALDAIVQLSVLDKDLTTPPASPGDGDRYIVAVSATGAWAGHEGEIAAWQDNAWMFYAPQQGWLAWVADENKLYAFDGSSWGDASTAAHQNVALMGVNATADSTNRLSVSAPACLFNHEGTDHQLKINKNTAADKASILFQAGYSGRAEIGAIGSDDFAFKVSGDGSAFRTALLLERNTGTPRFPAFTVAGAPSASTAGAGAQIFVSDEAGGPVMAFSDGSNWRRLTDRAIIS